MCEHIPYLILSVRQLMHELFDSHRMRLHPILCRSDTSVSRWASRRAHLEPPAEATQASRRARCWACLKPSTEAIHEGAVGQGAGPVSIPTIRQSATSDPSSKPLPWSHVRSGAQAAASRCRRYRTKPLRLFAVNPLTVGELGRRVIGDVILV